MQENEFEKNLQQKLDALQVQPTEEVWQKIKVQVAEKKRKRRFVFAFLFAVLFGITALVTLNLNRSTVEQQQIEVERLTHLQAKPEVAMPVVGDSDKATVEKNTGSVTVLPDPVSGANVNEDLAIEKKSSLYNGDKAGKHIVSLTGTVPAETVSSNPVKRKTKGSFKATTIEPGIDEADDKGNRESSMAVARVTGTDATLGQNNNEENKAVAKTITALVEREDQVPVVAEKNDPQEKDKVEEAKTISPKKKDKDRKWGIAFSVAAGRSFINASSQDKAFLEDYTSGGIGGSPNNGGVGGNYYMPSALGSGIGLTAGVGVYRKLTPSMKLMMGLQYSFNASSIRTGSHIENIIEDRQDSGFRYGSSHTYTNKYHYLSVPVSLSVKLFNVGKKEVSMDAGITISRLLSANTLEFNAAQSRYYIDDSRLNKTLTSLSLSANINLAAGGKPALYIGPQLNYSLTPLASKGLHANRRMTFVGLKLQKNLWK